MNTEIKSKKRISKHGEVFTNKMEVIAMSNLVEDETKKIQTTFLEPACGNGNFLIEILSRKLKICVKNSKKNIREYEKNSLISISSIYGIEIQLDNVEECRRNLLNRFSKEYKKIFKEKVDEKVIESASFILSKNIIHGNALNMKFESDGSPIKFTNWSILRNDFIMEEFLFEDLLVSEKESKYFPKSISHDEKDYRFLRMENV